MDIFGVCNASPDSLNADSLVADVDSAVARARQLLADGANAIDLGGQGSTFMATQVTAEVEWARLAPLIGPLAALDVSLSVDTWNPDVMRSALDAGATVMNAADAMRTPAMWELAAERQVNVVLPFMLGDDPLHLEHVKGDAIETMIEWFAAKLATATRYGIRELMILDPGTGFAPLGWEWADRYHYQKHVYSNLDRLRAFDLPLYIALPWRVTEQHEELLNIVLRHDVQYGRAHYPAHVRKVEADIQR